MKMILTGGYRTPFDPTGLLDQLEGEANDTLHDELFRALWENLHHQGDVGTASYFAVPRLIRICIAKNTFDWNFIGLIVGIEHCRHLAQNPVLPKDLKKSYMHSLQEFEQYLLNNLKNIPEEEFFQLTLAFLL